MEKISYAGAILVYLQWLRRSSLSKSVSICNRSHARWAISDKITISQGGGSRGTSLMPSFEKNLLTQQHEIGSQETRDSTLYAIIW